LNDAPVEIRSQKEYISSLVVTDKPLEKSSSQGGIYCAQFSSKFISQASSRLKKEIG
jgi:hypothetical protein